jgi:serine/threonine-protein kinase
VEGYEILTELGRLDGRGRCLARHRGTGKLVMLQMAPRGLHASPAELDEARAKLAVLALMEHPHLEPILAVGEHDGTAVLVRPHSGAVELSALLAVGPLAPRQAVRWVAQVASAVACLHEHGVFGPDLGVEDVLVEGDARLNAARVAHVNFLHPPLPSAAPEGAVLGVPSNLNPEQLRGAGRPDDPRRDVWALGVLLYRSLTGRQPFAGDTVMTTVMAVLETDPPAPRELRPELPAELEAICLRCLRKKPEERDSNVNRLEEALRAFLDGGQTNPASEPAPTLAARMGRWVRGWWPGSKG